MGEEEEERRKCTSYASQDKIRTECFLVLESRLEAELQEALQAI